MINGLFLHTFILAADMRDSFWMQYALWWSLPLMAVGIFALITTIIQFVKMIRSARICRIPLAGTNKMEIDRIGRLFLLFEVPTFSSVTGNNLNYELFNRQRGDAPIEMKSVPAPLTMKTGSKRTFPVRVFQITETGKYLLKIFGFDPLEDRSSYSLIISRPTALKSFLFIFGIVLTGLMFAGGLVFTIIAANANK